MGTRLKVTNLLNSKSVLVRVNDRGPAIPGRLIDISMAAAKMIGLLGPGIGPVQLEIVSTARPTPMAPSRQEAPAPVYAAF
jgi:rare lipoprotein A